VGQEYASQVPNIPAPGDLFAGKYEIEGTLGTGGMGTVLAARHVQLGQRVAIKFMLGEMAANQNAVARFVREARAAAALSSEHVARVIDVGTLDSGAPYMVMEYLAGVDLGEVLARDGPMPVEMAVGLVLQACDAIAEAHATGIVHRDLKPANLFLTARMDGSPLVKVLDFGVSKAVSGFGPAEDPSLTATGSVMGSPGYMSPEQVRSTKDVDCRADIWSLGVILYELLTGISPFVGQTLGDTFARIVSEDPPPIREHRRDVPAGLVAVISRCLERKLDTRIPNVGVLASKLLPFAPKESGPLVESILRVLGRSEQAPAVVAETAAAPTAVTSGPLRAQSSAAAQAVETGPHWLRSTPGRPAVRGKRGPVLVVASLVIAIATALFVYARRSPTVSRGATEPNDKVAAGLAPSAPVPAPGPPSAPSESVALISDTARLTDARSDTNTLEPLEEASPPLPPTHHSVASGPPTKPAVPKTISHSPSPPAPSTKRHEIDVY
jgi:serine/threonine-protein kinase